MISELNVIPGFLSFGNEQWKIKKLLWLVYQIIKNQGCTLNLYVVSTGCLLQNMNRSSVTSQCVTGVRIMMKYSTCCLCLSLIPTDQGLRGRGDHINSACPCYMSTHMLLYKATRCVKCRHS